MKVEKLNNHFDKINFRGPLELEDFHNSPTLHNFRCLDNTEKIDMIYDTLLKQNEKISRLSKNQQKLHNFNYDAFVTILYNASTNDYYAHEKLNSRYKKQVIDIIA